MSELEQLCARFASQARVLPLWEEIDAVLQDLEVMDDPQLATLYLQDRTSIPCQQTILAVYHFLRDMTDSLDQIPQIADGADPVSLCLTMLHTPFWTFDFLISHGPEFYHAILADLDEDTSDPVTNIGRLLRDPRVQDICSDPIVEIVTLQCQEMLKSAEARADSG